MDFTAALVISPKKPLDELAAELGSLLQISFIRDESGRYDEFPAFVANAIGIEFALLGIPSEEDLDEIEPVTEYSLSVQTTGEAEDDDIETDLSVHLQSVLRSGGIKCLVGNA